MLILTRKEGERIIIINKKTNEILTFDLLEKKYDWNNVRIGINAPKHYSIYREEILSRYEDIETAKEDDNYVQ